MAVKKIKFTLEFERPEKGDILSVKCPVCKAKPGQECTTRPWSTLHESGGNKVHAGHHDRIALVMNLEVVQSGQLYRIKG